jgi:serine/threonine protein kinase/Tol biopolymer transport system component
MNREITPHRNLPYNDSFPMALANGTKLGPYEIQSPLGAGGMGEVYRARDTRLDRTVAIKILPAHLSDNPEAKQRFDREARAISSLNHVNICTLYDVGSQDGTDFLVMEHLEGETLADRLTKGPLPPAQVLKYGIEICQGLEKAHRHGIIHRDLKPGNIMLTKSGAKLMDFGLAKPELAIAGNAKGPSTPSTPTMNLASLTSAASPLTQKGSIVGTFQYLSPEVLHGTEADARSDIFGLGCVLYEMVTGRRAFEAKSQIGVLSAILEKEPEPIVVSQPLAPPMLDRVIRGCLAKDPADRFQSAHDVAMDLRWIADSSEAEKEEASPAFKKSWALSSAIACLALIALAGIAGYQWSKRAQSTQPIHAEIPPPDKFSFDATGDNGGMPVLSPQGDRIAFVARSADAQSLWVRPLASDAAQPLEGTQGAAHPFWSPDGQYLGFFANGKLSKVATSGGPVTVLADAPNPRGGTWGADDTIVFTPNFLGPLFKVSAQSGTPNPATVIDKDKHTTHRWPWFLPDGKHFLFLAASHTGGDPKATGIYFGSVDSAETHMVVATDSAAQYGSGYLLYRVNTALVAQPFDPESGKLSGSLLPLVANIRYDVGVWRSIFSTSQNGLMVYQAGNAAVARSRLAWLDRSGKELGSFDVHENSMNDVHLSPDGKRVAFITGSPTAGVWTLDFERNAKTRVTFDQQTVAEPFWSADGKSILFSANLPQGGGMVDIRSKAADGSGTEKTLSSVPNNYHRPRWSPDGKYLTYIQGDNDDKMTSLWMVPLAGGSKPVAIVQPPSPQFTISNYRISPDSRWVAYVSDESGRQELYVTTFPDGKGKWPVPSAGAGYPIWSANGKELFFKNLTDEIFACSVTSKASEIEIGTPHRLFHASMPGIGAPYDVSADGQRFLVNLAQEEGSAPLKIVSNWPAALKK